MKEKAGRRNSQLNRRGVAVTILSRPDAAAVSQRRQRPKSNRGPKRMSAPLQLELNDRQRDILMRGLRFVRSSRMLEMRDTSEVTEEQRHDELTEIRQLYDLLDMKQRKHERAAV
jgi:hypothetical protein